MDDLYDEFGNFIGEEVESDESSEKGADAADYVYDDEPEEAPAQEDMDIDGKITCTPAPGLSVG
jgi:U5 small nuclear ribonucleoprotein component